MNPFRHRKPSTLVVGDRILVGHADGGLVLGKVGKWRDLREVVVTGTEPGLVSCRDAQGQPFDIPYGTPPYGTEAISDWRIGQQVHWTAPLPNGTPEAVRAYAAALLTGERSAILVHLGPLRDGLRDAALVQHVADTRDDHSDGDSPWTGTSEGPAAFWSETLRIDPGTLPEGCGDGALVAAVGFRCRLDGGVTVTLLEEAATLGQFADRASVGAFLPPRRDPGASRHDDGIWIAEMSGPAGHLALIEARDLALARTEPNEALILWYGDGRPGCAVLGATGAVFHNADSVEDYLHDEEQAIGLYVFQDADWWSHTSYEGEHDAGLNGNWRAATPEDVARFGYGSPAALDAEIDDWYQWDEPAEGLSGRLMERAAEHIASQVPDTGMA